MHNSCRRQVIHFVLGVFKIASENESFANKTRQSLNVSVGAGRIRISTVNCGPLSVARVTLRNEANLTEAETIQRFTLNLNTKALRFEYFSAYTAIN